LIFRLTGYYWKGGVKTRCIASGLGKKISSRQQQDIYSYAWNKDFIYGLAFRLGHPSSDVVTCVVQGNKLHVSQSGFN